MLRIPFLLGLLFVTAAAFATDAAPKNPHLWEPRTKSVSVFKNGYFFILQEAEVELRDGWAFAADIPPAAFGSLAIFTRDEGTLVDIVGGGSGEIIEFNGTDEEDTLEARRARLDSLLNVYLRITYEQNGKVAADEGILKHHSEYAILENEQATFATPVAAIKSIQLTAAPMRIHVSRDGRSAEGRVTLARVYLAKGMTWVPEYTMQITGESSANLTLRGTIINEAEDLVHCDINLVVGVPNFAHAEHMAPIALAQKFRQMAVQAFPGTSNMSQVMSNAYMPVTAQDASAISTANVEQAIASLPDLQALQSDDFTVYKKETLTVRRGEKSIVTLMVSPIAFGHVYRWTHPGSVNHYLSLKNITSSAWTTGPCLIMRGDMPLTEDMLLYTPISGMTEIAVTTAVNLRTSLAETESGREFKKVSLSDKEHLDRVEITGEAIVENYEKNPITMDVKVPVKGKPLDAGQDGTMTVNTAELRSTERTGAVGWHLQLQPGERKILNYKYERFVPSN